MPQSKKRDAHKHRHIDYIPHEKKKASAKPAAIVFCTLIGLAIGWFSAREFSIGVLVGGAIGAAIGYFLGSRMDRSFKG